MSRIYNNQPLESLPVNNVLWENDWDESEFTRNGNGIILESVIKKRSRVAISDASKQKLRYLLLHTEILRAHNRRFNENGAEIEPNFSETERLRTGYLNSSYKVAAKGVSDQLSLDDVKKRIEVAKIIDIQRDHAKPLLCTFWISEGQCESIEISDGDKIRMKTRGDSPFLESLGKIDKVTSTVNNYAGGEQVGSSWTDKVMVVKEQISSSNPGEQGDGADDDEWED